MKKNLKNYAVIAILLTISVLLVSCKSEKKDEKEKNTPEQELKVAAEDGFSQTYFFPNCTFKPQKEILPNDDIILHPEVYLKGQVPDAEATYDVTLMVDYYDNVDVSDCKFVVTAISPDSASRRTQQYKIVFNEDKQDKVIATENGLELKRNTRCLFKGMKFSTVGEAQFKVALAPAGGRFSFTGIKSVSVKVEKVKEQLES
jgi:hypothetical protein